MKWSCQVVEPVAVIRAEGRYDPSGPEFGARLSETVTSLLGAGCKRVILDLEIPYLGSRVLGVIYSELSRLNKVGGNLVLVSQQRTIRDTLRQTTLLLPLFETEQEALCYLVYGSS